MESQGQGSSEGGKDFQNHGVQLEMQQAKHRCPWVGATPAQPGEEWVGSSPGEKEMEVGGEKLHIPQPQVLGPEIPVP